MTESVKLTDNFTIHEFVPKSVYERFGNKSIWFIDIRIVRICQFLRDYIDRPLKINDWHIGGSFQNSGFRLSDETVGSPMSQHKYGRAADIKIEGFSTDEIHEAILNNWGELSAIGLTTLEKAIKTPTWCHLDTRYTGMSSIFFV